MSDIIIVGCGRVGSELATLLSKDDNNVTVIDRDVTSFANLGSDFNGATVSGVGFDEATLVKAGIESCDAVAAVTHLDNTNLMVAEVADKLYHVKHVIARLQNTRHERAYSKLGIDYACGTSLVTEEIYGKLSSDSSHHIESFGDFDIIHFTLDLRPLHRRSIRVGDLERTHILRVIGFERSDGTSSSIPDADSIIYQGDSLWVVLRQNYLPAIQKFIRS